MIANIFETTHTGRRRMRRHVVASRLGWRAARATRKTPPASPFSSGTAPPIKTLACLSYDYTENMLDKRGPYRPQHLEHAQRATDAGTLVLGGPFSDMSGALLVFTSEEAASEFATVDPYVTSGLVTGWSVKELMVVTGSLYPHLS